MPPVDTDAPDAQAEPLLGSGSEPTMDQDEPPQPIDMVDRVNRLLPPVAALQGDGYQRQFERDLDEVEAISLSVRSYGHYVLDGVTVEQARRAQDVVDLWQKVAAAGPADGPYTG